MKRKLIVTGASNGIGAHLCARAIGSGFSVVGLSRTSPKLEDVDWRQCDVSDPESIKSATADLRRDPSIFGLVNAAGIASMNLTIATPPTTIERIIATNLLGTIYCCSILGKALARRGTGRIVNFSTLAVPIALKGEAVYAASKAGVETFSRAFAREMGDFGVTVNVIAPGPMDTKLIAKVPRHNVEKIINQQLITRMGTPEDVWKILEFLFSDSSSLVTGDVFHIGGA